MTDPDPSDFPFQTSTDRTSEVLQQLSHDIRSAMSDVLGGIRLVDTPRLDPQTQTQIDRVRAAADTLAVLVDDVLLTASGETLIDHPSSTLVLAEWLEATQDRWFGRAAERDCTFKIAVQGILPRQINAASIALDRIVGNLISNALVHSAGHAVELDVRCGSDGALVLTVRDEGTGFPNTVLEQKDSQLRPEQNTRGSGLGLRIVRALSEQIGASVRLSNSETGGACATIRLPAALLDWTAHRPAPAAPPDLTGLRLLVAEDNLTNQTILRQMLDQMGASASFVVDGEAAIKALQSGDYDLGLIDIEMPRMSGLEVMEQVRADASDLASMPLVAITAYVMRDNREAIYAAGADGIIGKPVASPADFGRAILRHVGQPVDVQHASAAQASVGMQQKMDEGRLQSLLEAAGPQGSAELLDRVIEDLTSVLAALDDGVPQGKLEEIRAQTHILIAISGALGAERLCQMSEALNIAAKRINTDQLPALYAPLRQDHEDLLDLIKRRRTQFED